MANITTCGVCGKAYEAGSEESANDPTRLCRECWKNRPRPSEERCENCGAGPARCVCGSYKPTRRAIGFAAPAERGYQLIRSLSGYGDFAIHTDAEMIGEMYTDAFDNGRREGIAHATDAFDSPKGVSGHLPEGFDLGNADGPHFTIRRESESADESVGIQAWECWTCEPLGHVRSACREWGQLRVLEAKIRAMFEHAQHAGIVSADADFSKPIHDSLEELNKIRSQP